MPIDFNSLFSSAVSQLSDLTTALNVVLISFGGIYVTLLGWRLVKDVLSGGCDEGLDDDFTRANEGYIFTGDPDDEAAIDDFMEESEQRYREYITTDDE